MNSQGIVSNQGNAIADNETILHLLTLVLHVQFAVGVFIIGGETDIYFTEVCAMKNLLKWGLHENKIDFSLIWGFSTVYSFLLIVL